jgi:hypothetical protein
MALGLEMSRSIMVQCLRECAGVRINANPIGMVCGSDRLRRWIIGCVNMRLMAQRL